MSEQALNEKIENLFKNKDFLKELFTMQTPKEVKQLFNKNGVDITDEELEGLKKVLSELSKKAGSISDEELSQTAGGFNVSSGVASAVVNTSLFIPRVAGKIAVKSVKEIIKMPVNSYHYIKNEFNDVPWYNQ